jgi:hypothetical protein
VTLISDRDAQTKPTLHEPDVEFYIFFLKGGSSYKNVHIPQNVDVIRPRYTE